MPSLVTGASLTLGALLLLDAFRVAVGLDACWWLDLRWLGAGFAQVFRLGLGAALVHLAWRPTPLRRLGVGAALLVGAAATRDALVYSMLLAGGVIHSRRPAPLSWLTTSLVLAGVALFVARRATDLPHDDDARRWPARVATLGGAGALATVLALAQMVCFGATDYRREVDAVVVLGARTYADGRPSLALADRVRTGCALMREGRAATLILSGGPGDGATHETEAMRRLALECGVPAHAIVLDPHGLDTRRTAANSRRLLAPGARVLAVSHDYHLPRVKLALARVGLRAFTVPARETRTLVQLPYYMLREVAAFWVYYLGDAFVRTSA